GELGNAVQDAFVIAVEQQARERLQRLSALKRITPVDMSQLSIKASILKTTSSSSLSQSFILNQQSQAKGGATQDLSFLKEASPIYVTSLSSNSVTGTNTSTTVTAGVKQTFTAGANNTINNNTINSNSHSTAAGVQTQQNATNNNGGTGLTGTTSTTGSAARHQQVNITPSDGSTGGYANVRQSVGPTGTSTGGAAVVAAVLKGSDDTQQLPGTNNNNSLALGGGAGSGAASAYHLHPSLVNNNNLNSNIVKPLQGLDSTANSYYSNLTNTFLANGHGSKRELATLSEGELEPQDEPEYESSGNISRGGTEVLLGDQNLRQENR
uniref:Uncharacterized protein n=1 Tax=Anopheles epiroticus TaxID=199890 RepID=A0A182PH69_9DIPT